MGKTVETGLDLESYAEKETEQEAPRPIVAEKEVATKEEKLSWWSKMWKNLSKIFKE
jgi:hypothetical protein